MPTLQCRHCAAPLPEAAASGPVTCPYCQTVNEPTTAVRAQPPALSTEAQKEAFKEAIKEEIEERILRGRPSAGAPAPMPAPPRPRSLGESLRGCLTGCGCLVVLLGGSLVYGFLKDPGAVVRGFRQFAGGGLLPSDLRQVTSHTPVPLQVPAPPQGFRSFDPGRDLPWLAAQARAWAPDARLRRLRAVRLREDGTLDLAGDSLAEVVAEFDSPAAFERSLATRARSYREVNTGLVLKLARGKVEARLEWGGARQAPHPDLAAPLAAGRLLGGLRAAHRLPEQPLFNAQLAFDPKQGWLWTFQGLSRPDPLPRLRAEDGAPVR